MSHPSDPEGETEHPFDSDHSGGSISGDDEKKSGEGPKDEEEISPAAEEQQGGLSSTTNGAQERDQSGGAEGGNGQSESEEEERSRESSISSDSCKSDVVIDNASGVEEPNSLHSKRPSGTLPVDSKEVDDEDGYHQSQNESEEEEELPSAQRHSSSKGRSMSSPRRVIRSRRHRSSSSTSTESDDTDSEGSSCSSSVEPTNLAKPKPRVNSAGSESPPPVHPEDSEDTVTDVTPLSSPDGSPHQTLDLNDREDEDGNVEEQQLESVPASGKTPQDSFQDVNESSPSSDSQHGGRLAPYCPAWRNTKNYSFNNVEVRRIDRENERLLRAMSRLYSMSSAGRALAQKNRTQNNLPFSHLAHSATNRQREQQRIVRENLVLLKRLMSIKPTKGLKCSEQLADYHQQRYWGTPTQPSHTLSTQSERTPSMTPADTERRLNSPAHHNATSAATPETPSMREPSARPKEPGARPKEPGARPKEPSARPKEPGAARPAWD